MHALLRRSWWLVPVAVAACTPGTPDAGAATATGAAPAVPAAVAPSAASHAVHLRYATSLDVLRDRIDALLAAAQRPARSAGWGDTLRLAFADARDAYKRSEALLEFEAPTTASELNGPPLPEIEEEEGVATPVPADGFQVVEEKLFPEADARDSTELRNAIIVMQGLVARARTYAKASTIDEPNLFDAVRQQVARVSVLALADFDSPVARRGLHEGALSLEALDALVSPLGERAARVAPRAWADWRTRLAASVAALRAVRDIDDADRLELTRVHLVPLAHAWWRLREAMGVPLPADPRPWRVQAASVFDRGAFDAWQFAPAWGREGDNAAAVRLGRTLFHDVRLSGDGTRSCASCHLPERAFSEPRERSASRSATVRLRNAPTLLNAALQRAQFADARTAFLEDQVADVVENVHELAGRVPAVAASYRADPAMRALFRDAFGERGDSTVTAMRVQIALAAYERSLVALDSPFDRYVRGDSTALPRAARRGYDVFMGKGRCGTCHFAPLFNGTVPPDFRKSELEVLGTPATRGWKNVRLDADRGRAAIFAAAPYEHAFKTPTVRNAALTAPYMHNGVYRTLDEVTEFYARGGGLGLGIAVDNQTLPGDRIHLTKTDRDALHAFIRALTDTAGTTRR
jgi:cytochrome c peroxidase